jgi:hypothetical protein
MQTLSYTHTYTIVDIRRVLDNFAADFAMIAQATGLRTRDNVDDVVADLKSLAERDYLQEIHLTLYSATGVEIKAARYTISTTAEGWATRLPGNNLWPRTPGGELAVGIRHSQKFMNLDEDSRIGFFRQLRRAWGATDMDFSHNRLISSFDRRYASNGWGLEKRVYQ